MRSDSAFSVYEYRDDAVRKLHPTVKFLVFLVLTIATFTSHSWFSMVLVAVIICLIAVLAHIAFQQLLGALRPVSIVLAFALIPQTVRFGMSGIILSQEGFMHGLIAMTRIALVVELVVILNKTTTSLQLAEALLSLISPLKKLGLNIGALKTTIMLVVRFIPLAAHEFKSIQKAQMMRGINFEDKNLFRRLSTWLSVFIPLIVRLFQRSSEYSDALRERLYGLSDVTYSQRPTLVDGIVLLGAILVSIGLVLL